MDYSFVYTNATEIPIRIVTQTSWNQYIIGIIMASAFSMYVLAKIFGIDIANAQAYMYLIKMRLATKRPSIVIRHNQEGIFGGEMIDGQTLNKVEQWLAKKKGKDVNIVIKSPGGYVFHAMYLSKIIASYPGKTHVYVPQYAMSGGTLLALSGDFIYMNPQSSLGRIDPQLGDFFGSGSRGSYEHVVRMKNKKSDDKTVNYQYLSRQVEGSIVTHVESLLKSKGRDGASARLVDMLVRADLPHLHQFGPADLSSLGLRVCRIPSYLRKTLVLLTSIDGKVVVGL